MEYGFEICNTDGQEGLTKDEIEACGVSFKIQYASNKTRITPMSKPNKIIRKMFILVNNVIISSIALIYLKF